MTDAINGVDSRVSSIESNAGYYKPPIIFAVSQIDMPVGSKVTVNGTEYTIAQFEFPRYDTDETYIIKIPTDGAGYLDVQGVYSDQELEPLQNPNFSTTINGFPVLGWESVRYTTHLMNGSTSSFSQSIGAYAQIGSKTRVSLSLPRYSNQTSSSSASLAKTSVEREQIRKNLRQLLSYVVIKKK